MFLFSRWALPVWLLLAFKAYTLLASPVPQGATPASGTLRSSQQGQQAPYFLRPSYDQALANACAANDLGSCDLLSVRRPR